MGSSSPLGSQVSGSMCSLSFPSAPADVGNWFASYNYESPQLGTNTGFGDSVSRESQRIAIGERNEENVTKPDEIGKTRCGNELDFVIENESPDVFANKQESQSSSEIPDSSFSPSGVSEPPDIRNWCASYIYESFVLDTNDEVKDSVSHETERENVGVFKESRSSDELGVVSQGISSNGSFEDDEHDDRPLKKALDSLDSSAPFTEPPDVKIWFSSYVNESPALNTSEEYEDSLHLGREPKENELVIEDSKGDKEVEKIKQVENIRSTNEEVDVEDVHLNETLEHNSSFGINKPISKDIERIEKKENTSSQKKMCSIKIFKEILEGKTTESNGMGAPKKAKESRFNNGVSMSTPLQEFSQAASSVALYVNTNSGNNSKKTPSMEESSDAGATRQIHKRIDKENTENGFVATRKNGCARTEKEGFKERAQEMLLECTRNQGTVCAAAEKNEALIKRKVLTETTNFQGTDAIGVTGKWRCPQKGKPSRGPPLKQLRLERWIHKV